MSVLPTMEIIAATTMSASRDTSRCMFRTCADAQHGTAQHGTSKGYIAYMELYVRHKHLA
jgi:hypothetical protein